MATDPMLDPDYKYSINKFTGNGSKTSWDLNFSGGYIRREHVKAYTEAADGQITELSFTWSGPNTIVITPPVANGLRLFVYRDTPKNGPLVDFTDGAIINEYDLDMLARQTVFATAEMVDRFADVAIQADGATAVATEALFRAADAQDKVALSNSTSSAALLAAQGAVTTANTANTNAVNAVGVAGAANATADAANTKADTAIATANTALANANAATGIANTAAGQASSAVTTAGAANTKADNAVTRALAAQDAAANATTIAAGAEGTANNVASQFDALRDTVEEIAGGDLSNFVRVTQENTFVEKQTFSAGAVIGGVQWGGSGANAKIINAWGDLTGKPSTFPPSAHSHAITDITSLQTTLDAKASNSALTAGLAAKADKASPSFTGVAQFGPSSQGYLKMVPGDDRAGNVEFLYNGVRMGYVGYGTQAGSDGNLWLGTYGNRRWVFTNPPALNGVGDFLHVGNFNSYAVSVAATNLGRTGGGPIANVTVAGLASAPTGYSILTNSASAGVPMPGGVGHFFKFGRRDHSDGYAALWGSFQPSPGLSGRLFLGNTPSADVPATWNEVATLNRGDQDQQDFQGVNRFINGSRPGLEIWHPDGRGLRFGPAGGFSFAEGGVWGTPDPSMNLKNLAVRNKDESFRDLTAQRGDGSGAIFLGGGAYLYHNTAGVYEFGGTKDVQLAGTARLRYGGGRQPRISVQSNAPTAEMVVGDLWAW